MCFYPLKDRMKAGTYTTTFLKDKVPFVYCTDPKDAKKVLNTIVRKYPTDWMFGFDTETAPTEKYSKYPKAGLAPHLSKIRLMQLYTGKGVVVFDIFSIGDMSMFKRFFETYRFVAHYAGFDLKQLYREGITKINIDCTMLMFQNLVHAKYPTDAGIRAGLAYVVEGFFGIKVNKANQAHHWDLKDLTYEQVEYAALDAIYVKKVYDLLLPILRKKRIHNYYLLCKNLQYAVCEMEFTGIRLNRKKHIANVDLWREELFAAKKKLMKITKLNKITSATIGKYLEENLDKDYLDIWPRTATGKLQTDSQVFSEFEHLPIVKPFSKFKEMSKLTTSFGTNLLKHIDPETKRLHPSYKICGARTGRMSCNSPNLQQMPRRKDIRESFVAGKGQVFVSCDYSMIELRVIAELSRDIKMLEAFRAGKDLHTITAAAISHVPENKLTKEQRQVAKACNYGFIYGLGYAGLITHAKKLFGIDLSMEESREIKDSFGDLYYGVTEWQIAQVKVAQTLGKISTPYGKVRKLEPTNCYGAAMNTPVQGGAAECIFLSLLFLLKNRGELPFKIVTCVHDEIMLECSKTYSKRVAKLLEKAMTAGFLELFPKGVTTGLVEAKIGKSWGDVH